MKITFKDKITDPVHPIMHGNTPIAKEFNKRMAVLWVDGRFQKFDFELVTTILLEILIDDYDKRNSPPKRVKKQ